MTSLLVGEICRMCHLRLFTIHRHRGKDYSDYDDIAVSNANVMKLDDDGVYSNNNVVVILICL